MLRDLHIRNLAILEEATIEFGPGLNVLSGETGAGKSIIVDSLALLAGVRASAELIRTGAEALQVTGVFEPRGDAWRQVLAAAGLDGAMTDGATTDGATTDGATADGAAAELVIRREVTHAGRNRVFVNDRPVTLKLLADLAPSILRIHGQREELGLKTPDLQRTWLDRRGGAEAEELLATTAETYARYREAAARLERLTGDDRMRQERIDLLRFQIAEIAAAEISEGEEEALRRERETLRHSEAIRGALGTAVDLLFEGDGAARDALVRARHGLDDVAAWEGRVSEWAAELEELGIRLAELEPAMVRRRDEVEADPRRLDEVEDRLALLERLLRKYGATSAEVLEHLHRSTRELEELEGDASAVDELRDEVDQTLAAYRIAAQALSRGREAWAAKLAREVGRHLEELALGKARFEVGLERRRRAASPLVVGGEAVDFSELGFDQVTFLFSPNPGEELRALARAASGGELSRLYLAVQLASRGDQRRGSAATLVFDEVDAGVSGAEAAALGGKLRRLAQGGQIFVVTHLPQVASCADVHFKVRKRVEKQRTFTAVERLSADGRVEEVARMLAGTELTELSLSHARELIAAA